MFDRGHLRHIGLVVRYVRTREFDKARRIHASGHRVNRRLTLKSCTITLRFDRSFCREDSCNFLPICLVDNAALHDECDSFQLADVLQRIS